MAADSASAAPGICRTRTTEKRGAKLSCYRSEEATALTRWARGPSVAGDMGQIAPLYQSRPACQKRFTRHQALASFISIHGRRRTSRRHVKLPNRNVVEVTAVNSQLSRLGCGSALAECHTAAYPRIIRRHNVRIHQQHHQHQPHRLSSSSGALSYYSSERKFLLYHGIVAFRTFTLAVSVLRSSASPTHPHNSMCS